MTTHSEPEVIFGTRKITQPSLITSVIKLTVDAKTYVGDFFKHKILNTKKCTWKRKLMSAAAGNELPILN